MRVLAALLLSLCLAVTSVTMALARGQEPMGPTLTLCSEGGTTVVTLDAQGDPVETHAHICPDCLSGLVAFDLPGQEPPQAQPATRASKVILPTSVKRSGLSQTTARARAPPSPIV